MTTKRLHGKFDAILILVTVLAIGSFVGASLFVVVPQSGSGGVLPMWLVLPAVSAVLGAVLLATFGMTKLWLLLGNTSLSKRLCLVALVDFIPSAYFLIGFSYAELRLGFAQPTFGRGIGSHLLVGVLTQRLLTWMVFAAMGCAMQFFSRWRLTGPIGRPGVRRNFQTSIGDIMVLTAFAAGMCACLTYWMQVAGESQSQRFMGLEEIIVSICIASALEVGVVLLFLLLPLCVSHGAPWLRRHFPTGVALWACFIGAIASVFGFLIVSLESLPAALGVSLGILLGHAFFGATLFFVLYIFLRAGFRYSTRSKQDAGLDSSGRSTRRVSWTAGAICMVAMAITVCFYSVFDLPILLVTGSFTNARVAATMSRKERTFPAQDWIRTPSWNGQRISFLLKSNAYYFTGDEQKLIRLVRTCVPKSTRAKLTLHCTDPISKSLLDELAIRKFSHLELDANVVQNEDFDAFCKIADVESLVPLMPPRGNARLLDSIAKLKTLKSISLPHTYEWNSENAKAIQALPLKSVGIQLLDGKLDNLAALKALESLTISSSLITQPTIDQLSQLMLKKLRFHNCTMDAVVARQFSKLRATNIQWDESGRPEVSDETLFAIVESSTAKSLDISTEREWDFGVKLENRTNLSEISVNATGDYDETETTALEGEELFRRLATEVVRNDEDNITEIDLQEVELGREEFDELEKLKKLRRLRIGAHTQTRKWFQRIAEFGSLQELEVSGYQLDSYSFREICKLENLKRLQLPICITASEFRHPEDIPIQQQKVEKLDLDNLSMRLEEMAALRSNEWMHEEGFDPYEAVEDEFGYGGGYGYEGYGPDDIADVFPGLIGADKFKAISKLQDLEYLFMPGYLLTEDSLKEIEKLPKLTELHAVLSVVDHKLLERIVQLEDLESLSIGTQIMDAKFVEILSRHKKLATLQVTFFNQQVLDSPKLQRTIQGKLQTALPNCKVHLIFARGLNL